MPIALRVPDVDEARTRARGEGRRVHGARYDRLRRVPHGDLPRPGRERAAAASEVRASEGRPPRALPGASASDDERRALALHRPARVRPRGLHGERGDERRAGERNARRRRGRDRPCERGRNRDRARAGGRRVRAPRERPAARHAGRDGREVRGAQRGRVEERPSRARPEGRRAREAALRPHRQLGGRRRALLAAARGRRGRQPFLLHRGVRLRDAGARRLLERGHGALRRAGREARVRLHPEPVARDVALRVAPGAGRAAMPSWTGSRAASARRRARSGSRTTSRARGRPRA